ncbi:MAG: SH3 domain-containing protein [Paracoccus sp. (in: a-proteobacteria)]|uniref:COG3650 family protein n=1 Tax=Paracoccus sp. TaxID=267 RepID=UPI0026E0165C|nr:SH3 domain-containing protein [Paracoccus sp. (in: a-proteobacteria)]MDO5611962.1 SH3 domain-containing protein [Paracoccus sp. (in: a-proteobacteria)]
MKHIALILMMTATPALATPEYVLPTLFDVSGVAADDVLNVRAAPSAQAEILATLRPDATGIEVVQEQDGWGRVNAGETSGWVAMRYMSYRTDVWDGAALPDGFRCFGTEPFWDARVSDGALVIGTPDATDRSLPVSDLLATGWFRDPTRVVLAQGASLTASPAICSDGMSDRLFGLRADLAISGQERLLSGCCTIQPAN